MHTFNLSLRQLFSTLFLLFVGLLAASALQAWTGPTATAPNGNVSTPINVSGTGQVKSGGLAVNGFLDSGTSLLSKLGINLPANSLPVVALDVNGTMRLGSGGEVCQAVTEGAQRYNSSTHVMEYCNGTAWTGFGSSGGVTYQSFTSSGTYTKPAGTTLVIVEAWGGGGGGGYGITNGYGNIGGGGGGGGACVNATLRGSDVGNTVTVTVGAGGSGSGSSYNDASPGGTTSFGTLVTAYGGGGDSRWFNGGAGPGGGGGALSAGTFGAGGAPDGGAPGASSYYGGGGGNSAGGVGGQSYCGGGGGGGGGNSGSYSNGTDAAALGGTSVVGGAGGAGGAPGHNGSAGTAPGGGGGGTSGSAVGGAGARGELRVWSFTGTP